MSNSRNISSDGDSEWVVTIRMENLDIDSKVAYDRVQFEFRDRSFEPDFKLVLLESSRQGETLRMFLWKDCRSNCHLDIHLVASQFLLSFPLVPVCTICPSLLC